MAIIRGRPYRAARMTESGLPPMPIQAHGQLELLLEDLLVLGDVIAEQGEGLDGGCPAEDHLSAAAGDAVDGGELLIEPHRVLRGQHRDGGAEVDAGGRLRCGGQHHWSRRVDRPLLVVLADAEDVQAHGLRQLRLLD
ncbi:MAG: hypothetical protein BGN97_16980 [Microbacterium sp. 69-10]|nr:MAG: hypothetical protein BGN97_16980 [Microbacterium sp. 69-10]